MVDTTNLGDGPTKEQAWNALSAQEQTAQLEYYLEELNTHWKRYGEIEDGEIVFNNPLTMSRERKLARESYAYAELWLAQHGYRWNELNYDQETRTYSFPVLSTSVDQLSENVRER